MFEICSKTAYRYFLYTGTKMAAVSINITNTAQIAVMVKGDMVTPLRR